MALHEVCEHEREFGQISEVLKQYDAHIEATNSQIKQLTEAVYALKSTVERQSEKISEFNSIKDGMLSLSGQLTTLSSENKDSLRRAHDKIDGLRGAYDTHVQSHCSDCKNSSGCDEAHEKVDDFIETMSPLVPFAKAIAVIRDKVILWLLVVILIMAAWIGITFISKKTGITPTAVQVEKKQ